MIYKGKSRRSPARLHIALAVLSGLLLTLGACGGGGTPVVESGEPRTTIRVPTDATHPLLAEATRDGAVIRAYGERDEAGVPALVQFVEVDQAGEVTHFAFHEDGTWKRVVAPNGVTMDFEWQSASTAVVRVTTPDGLSQLTTEVDFVQAQESTTAVAMKTSPPSATETPDRNLAPRARTTTSSVVLPQQKSAAPADHSLSASPEASVFIDVTTCGDATDSGADVWLRVDDVSNNEFIGNFPAQRVGPSTYRTTIPTGQRRIEQTEDVCQQVTSALGAVCPVFHAGPGSLEAMCIQITAALLTTPLIGDELIGAGCVAIVAAGRLYCDTLGYGPIGGPDIASGVCDLIFDDTDVPSALRLTPRVLALPQNVIGAPKTVSASETGPWRLLVDVSYDPQIQSVVLSPSAPAEGQSYVATAHALCLPAGSVIHMAISGTDDYTDLVVHTVGASQRNGSFTLNVPGAEAGVRDVVTVRVILPTGEALPTKEAYLVFG